MPNLPTDRTTGNTAGEHVLDHNELHEGHNLNEDHRQAAAPHSGHVTQQTVETLADAAQEAATEAAESYTDSQVTKLVIDALGIDAATLEGLTVAQIQSTITAAIVDSAPATLNTLNEIAAALDDDDDFATTITNLIAAETSAREAADAAFQATLDEFSAASVAVGERIDDHIADTSAAHAATAIETDDGNVQTDLDAKQAISAKGHINVKDAPYSATGDGTTDDSAAVIAAIQAAYNAGGGVVFFPKGTYRCDSQIAIPNDAQATLRQPPITLVGVGSRWDGRWAGINNALGGSTLDLRYASTNAKILTLGTGSLSIRDLCIVDNGTSTTPFLLTTNTTLFMDRVTFGGNPSKSGTSCNQDAIILGGADATSGSAATSAFQGYGTVISKVYFSRIRRGVYGKTWCNSVVLKDLTFDNLCGGQTAVEIDGTAGFSTNNFISGCLVEMTNYTYGFTFTNSQANYCFGNSFWDVGATTTACVRLVGTSLGNEFWGFKGASGKYVEANSNSYLMSRSGVTHGTLEIGGGEDGLLIRPDAAGSTDATRMLRIARSLAEGTDPNGVIFTVSHDGDATVTGTTPSVAIVKRDGSATLTIDSNSIVRAQSNLNLYAGAAATDLVIISRGTLKIKAYTTAARPSASATGAGTMYYDTTLSKPVFSDGTVWRDAAGTAV